MEIWLNINLTVTLAWVFLCPFVSRRAGVNSAADFVVGYGGVFLLLSWPIYLLAVIWQ